MVGKKVVISVFLIILVLVVKTEDKKEKRFFKLLWKLDSIKRYKRKEAYEKLIDFLYKNPQEKYRDILKRRSRKVAFEQRLLLLNLIEKRDKLISSVKVLENNTFFQQCRKVRLRAIDFITDTITYYNFQIKGNQEINERTKREICTHLENYKCNRDWINNFLKQQFFYAGLFKEYDPLVINTFIRGDTFSSLETLLRNKGLPPRNDWTVWNVDRTYNVLDLFVYGKKRKTLKRIASLLLPFKCFKRPSYIYNEVFVQDAWDEYKRRYFASFSMHRKCYNFLFLFGKYLSDKSRNELKELFGKVVTNIKSKAVFYPLKQLLIFDNYISAIIKFKVFSEGVVYKSIIADAISNRLRKIRRLCRKTPKLTSLEREENIYEIEYISSDKRYAKFVNGINTACLYMYLENERRDNYLMDEVINIILPRFRVRAIGGNIVEQESSAGVCDRKILYNSICRAPLYVLKTVLSCRDITLKHKIIKKITDFKLYLKNCGFSFFVIQSYHRNRVLDYLKALEVIGQTKRNLPKIVKYLFSQIQVMLLDRYIYNEVIIYLFTTVNKYEKKRRYELTEKILIKLLMNTLQKVNDRQRLLNIILTLINGALKSNPQVLENNQIKMLLVKTFYLVIVRYSPFRLRKYLIDIVKRLNGYEIYKVLRIVSYSNITSNAMDERLLNLVIGLRNRRTVVLNNPKGGGDKEGVTLPAAGQYQVQKDERAFLLLLLFSTDKKAWNKIRKKYKTNQWSKYSEIFEKTLSNIVSEITIREREVDKKLIGFLYNNSSFGNFIVAMLTSIMNNMCKGIIYDPANLVRYFLILFDIEQEIDESSISTYAKTKYKAIKLFPILLADVKNYIRLDDEIYFTTLSNLITKENVKKRFCGNNKCKEQYKLRFLYSTPKIVKGVYRILFRSDVVTYKNSFFYLPLIINTKTKEIIISDFVKLNNVIEKILKRRAQ